MLVVHSKHIKNSIGLYLSVFIILFCSNMVAAEVIGKPAEILGWLYGLVLLFFINKKILKKNLYILLGLLLFRLSIMILQVNFEIAFFNSIIDLILTMNMVMQIGQLYERRQITEAYINILFLISIISLICYVYLVTADQNAIFAISQISEQGYRHSWIYLWGWHNFLYARNAGPWWEPGAFQCFIAFAMLLIMSGRAENIKNMRIKLIVLVATWVTTQSTTGFYIMFVVLAMLYSPIMSIIFGKPAKEVHSIWKFILVLLLVVIGMFVYFNVAQGNIQAKIFSQNESADIRFKDILGSLEISMVNPIVGVGAKIVEYYAQYNIVNNSAALLILPISFGWIYTITLLAMLLGGIRRFFTRENKLKAIVAFAIIIILTMTEGIIELPIFYLFFVHYRDEKKEFKHF